MARRPDSRDLLFAREVAELLGYRWTNNIYGLKDLPAPIKGGPGGCRVWWRADIERYARARGRSTP